ncbi:BA14K family protein (plasmid) [Rhizobium sp. TRM96647]|uniref:BA14K family protein n=1 Tax=unclassified Rhizobium TaxID=2613769 RepID=UPI0021E942DC|nr:MULTISPECIES: BA14K family protein [unclassified Rhizobium]MCV3735467.1 BA14K family protein [Rhizobium sp. TRM96647]MCV3757770.1 BA14K family protein [Rhizobium sp. TRM96650]
MFGTRSIAVALSVLFAVSPVVPATSQAMPKMTVQAGESGVDLVRCEGRHCRDRRDWKRDHRDARRDWQRDRRQARRDYNRGYRNGYYNGHRGYRYARPGYRYHDGYWFPLAAFATGAIIGGAITAPRAPAYSGGGSAHTQWCYNRYRSYRAYDNTFQPYNGPRQQCYSPYG